MSLDQRSVPAMMRLLISVASSIQICEAVLHRRRFGCQTTQVCGPEKMMQCSGTVKPAELWHHITPFQQNKAAEVLTGEYIYPDSLSCPMLQQSRRICGHGVHVPQCQVSAEFVWCMRMRKSSLEAFPNIAEHSPLLPIYGSTLFDQSSLQLSCLCANYKSRDRDVAPGSTSLRSPFFDFCRYINLHFGTCNAALLTCCKLWSCALL